MLFVPKFLLNEAQKLVLLKIITIMNHHELQKTTLAHDSFITVKKQLTQ
jgi:hypothetical protein